MRPSTAVRDMDGPVRRDSGSPLRVLQVSAFFPTHGGGIEAVVGQLVQRLATQRVAVHWMASREHGADLRTLSAAGIEVTAARAVDFLESTLGLPAPLWGVVSLYRLWHSIRRTDVVHIHDYLYQPTLAAFAFAKLQRRPVVVTQHIGEIAFRSPFASRLLASLNRTVGAWVLGAAAQVVFVGRPVQSYFGRFVRFPRPTRLIANGVDHATYRDDGSGPGFGPLSILFVGRFVEKKGLALIADCIDVPETTWRFVGWGPLKPARQANVEVIGRLSAADVVPLYRAADLLVLPSTGEGFPLVVQEALACGTPVLVSTEVLEAFPGVDPECVFDVELRCANPAVALRQKVADLADKPERVRAARSAAARLSQQWSWDACTSQYLDVYENVCGAKC
jgi:glycosyltransferase involved in cell wall biosynthesis